MYRLNSQHPELPRHRIHRELIKQRDLRGRDNAHDAVGTIYDIGLHKLRGEGIRSCRVRVQCDNVMLITIVQALRDDVLASEVDVWQSTRA